MAREAGLLTKEEPLCRVYFTLLTPAILRRIFSPTYSSRIFSVPDSLKSFISLASTYYEITLTHPKYVVAKQLVFCLCWSNVTA